MGDYCSTDARPARVSNRSLFSNRRNHMPRKLFAAFLFTAALFWCVSAAAQTQITTGVIQGTVTDPQGAVVPGASVEVKHIATNLTRTATTDNDGRFVALL